MLPHHLIFEGPELAGKSWIISEVYKTIEAKYGRSKVRLDGCHWINCDFGLFGTEKGKFAIDSYINLLGNLKEKNVILEKFHLSNIVFNRLYLKEAVNHDGVENILHDSGYKIILVIFKEDEDLLEKRIQGRLNLYPHCRRVVHSPKDYIIQQREYLREIERSKLPYLIVETADLPDQEPIVNILNWIGE